MSLVVAGVVLVLAAVALFAQALFADPVPRISKSRLRDVETIQEPLPKAIYRSVVGGVDKVLKSRGWAPFRASELEMADIHKSPGVVVTWVGLAALGGLVVGVGVLSSLFLGLLLAVLAPVLAKMLLKIRSGKRRKLFAKQLDNTLRIISSALRAGQSLQIALHSVAADSAAPMSEEITRIINENRIGRDLVVAMLDTAERMDSEDFRWFAEAVAVQRDSGGSLNDIIDTVAETIRGRVEIREKIRAYSSEGRASCYVLMALPVGLGAIYSVMRPGYMTPMFTTTVGIGLSVLSAVLYTISWFWMRAIVDIKV